MRSFPQSSPLVLAVASSSAAQSGSLSAQDYIEIQQLYAKYAHALDLGDAEGWANTFTPGGVFGDSKGYDQRKAFADGFMESFDGQQLVPPVEPVLGQVLR